jgi:hypothetical protein
VLKASVAAGLILGLTGCLGVVGLSPANTPAPGGGPGGPGGGPGGPGGGPGQGGGSCTPGAQASPPIVPRLRRLGFAQYDNTSADLLSATSSPSLALGPEVDGVTAVMWSGFVTEAAALATPAAVSQISPCQPSGDGTACAQQFIATVGQRAFRRSLSDAEAARYMALYTSRADLTPTGTPAEGLQLILEALLQSPNFLVRVERSAGGPLSGVERASRLSYALWNGPPDDALLSAAESGALDTADGVRQAAQDMLTSPGRVDKARALIRAASQDFLGMVGSYAQFWTNTVRDPTLFPDFYSGIDADFREEVLRFIDRVVFDQNGGYGDLLTSPVAVVNAKLAPIYGLTTTASDWAPVTLDPDQRPGLLTRAGFVGTHGRFSRGSLIYRGAFVLRRLLCQDIGSPPAGAANTPLPAASGTLKTDRDRIQAMTAADACASCHHARINPAGFAMEGFDGIGKLRTTDHGVPVDTSGSIQLDGAAVSFNGPKDYAAALAGSSQARACYVNRFAQFTFTDATLDVSCTAPAAALAQPGATIKDFLVAFVSSDLFLTRSTMEAE